MEAQAILATYGQDRAAR
ncbi:hypothetical protein AB0N19_36415 [Streptomyces sp. NPDC051132]